MDLASIPTNRRHKLRGRYAGITAKQERFAQLIASGESITAAYRKCYEISGNPRYVHKNAQTAYHSAIVQQRIREIKASLARRASYDTTTVMNRLDTIYNAAMEAGEFSPATRSVELMGKQLGMFAEKTISTIRLARVENTIDSIDSDISYLLQIAQSTMPLPVLATVASLPSPSKPDIKPDTPHLPHDPTQSEIE